MNYELSQNLKVRLDRGSDGRKKKVQTSIQRERDKSLLGARRWIHENR